MSTENVTSERSGARRAPFWIALALHILIAFFPYAASGLMAPRSGVIVLAIIWLALFVALFRWRPANPWLLLVIPGVAIAVWFAVMAVGDYVFGWTA